MRACVHSCLGVSLITSLPVHSVVVLLYIDEKTKTMSEELKLIKAQGNNTHFNVYVQGSLVSSFKQFKYRPFLFRKIETGRP